MTSPYYRLDVLLKEHNLSAVVVFRSTDLDHIEFVRTCFDEQKIETSTVTEVYECPLREFRRADDRQDGEDKSSVPD